MPDKKKAPQDILYEEKPDRRLLSYVPDDSGLRSNHDRRGSHEHDTDTIDYIQYQQDDKLGQRYLVDYDVAVSFSFGGSRHSLTAKAVDISTTGMLLKLPEGREQDLKESSEVRLDFDISPGSMPEGYEMKIHSLKASFMASCFWPASIVSFLLRTLLS